MNFYKHHRTHTQENLVEMLNKHEYVQVVPYIFDLFSGYEPTSEFISDSIRKRISSNYRYEAKHMLYLFDQVFLKINDNSAKPPLRCLTDMWYNPQN